MSVPLISVIIPTYGREAVLRDTIADVLRQDYPNYEVLVIDQTQTHEPETQQYLDELAANQTIRLYQVAWASLPGARNYGVRRSTGEIIVFIDDDVQLPSGFLAAHSRNFQEKPEVGAVAGRVFDRLKLAEAEPGLAIDDMPVEAMNPALFWLYINLVHTVKPQQVLTARGCNMSFRREMFEQYGLWFDERFRGSAVREESDLCLQLRQTGQVIWYDPEAGLVHLGEETGGCHDISTRSLQYQLTFYYNHFLMGLKNLTPTQFIQFSWRLFDCHVLGHPPCYKSGSPLKVFSRALFYLLGFGSAIAAIVESLWHDGQTYTRQDLGLNQPQTTSQQVSAS
jgi:glycosyltransferase involved in cell wall biosynthesis